MKQYDLKTFIPVVDQRDVLIYAFRYTLGRATYAPHTIISILKANWGDFSGADKALYKREIKEAIDSNTVGHDIDKTAWASVLDLPDA